MKILRHFCSGPSNFPVLPSKIIGSLKTSGPSYSELLANQTIRRDLVADQKRLVYIRFLPKEWSEVHIQKYFDPKIEKIEAIQLTRNRLGVSTGKALLWMKNEKTANSFIELFKGDCIETKEIVQKIDVQQFEIRKRSEKVTFKRNTRVTIRNLAPQVGQKDIEDLCADYGTILKVHVPTINERSLNYAYVIFEKASSAENFYKCEQGTRMLGRELK